MRWGIRYMAPEGATAGSGGAAVNVISARHSEFKELLDRMESTGAIQAKPNEGVNLDTPIGKDPPVATQQAEPAVQLQAQQQQQQQDQNQVRDQSRTQSDDSNQDTLDDSGVDAEQSSGSDTSSEATATFVPSKHSDDLVRLATSYGLSRAVVDRLDDEALRMTLGDLARRQSFDPRLREGQQQVPQPYPQQAQQSQVPQPQQDQQQAPQVDWRAELARMKQSGDYDEKDLRLFEALGHQTDAAARMAMQANQQIQQQQYFAAQQQAQLQQRDVQALNVMIDQLVQPDVYGNESDFLATPPSQWSDAMKKQNANALALQQRVDWYRGAKGVPLTPELVKQAHFELFGAVKAAEKKEAAQRVVNQSRSRMGSSKQPGRGSGGTWSGPPGQDPELQEFFNSRQLANRGY